jgi:hypothetical protein
MKAHLKGRIIRTHTQQTRNWSLTRRKKISDPLVSLSKRIKNPPAPSEKSLMPEVVVIWQRSETVDPETDTLHFGSVDPRVALDPVWGAERDGEEGDDDDEAADGGFAGQRALPVNVGVGENVVNVIVHLLLGHHLDDLRKLTPVFLFDFPLSQ